MGMAFCCFSYASCNEKRADITVYMPDGAPALALAGMMSADTDDDGVTYRVVSADTISTFVTYEDETKNADVCVMPATAASKLLGDGERYKLVATLTHGNLYMISKNAGVSYTAENLSALVGKTVGVLQINAVPGLTFKTILAKHGVPYAELTNTGEAVSDKVNLKAISDIAAEDGSLDCYVVAEPAASVQAQKNGYAFVGDLQALYGADEQGNTGYPQAVMVVKNGLLYEDDDWSIVDYLQAVASSCDWVKTASGEEIVAAASAHMADASQTTSLKAPLLGAEVVARCGVRWAYVLDCKTRVSEFLAEMKNVNANAVGSPVEAFYWDGNVALK